MYNSKKKTTKNVPYHFFINSITIIKIKYVIEIAFYDDNFFITLNTVYFRGKNNVLTVSGYRLILEILWSTPCYNNMLGSFKEYAI